MLLLSIQDYILQDGILLIIIEARMNPFKVSNNLNEYPAKEKALLIVIITGETQTN